MTYCPTCSHLLSAEIGPTCPNCSTPLSSFKPKEEQLWGKGTGLLVWLASIVLIVGFQLFAAIVYFIIRIIQIGSIPRKIELDQLLAVLSVGSTFPAHLVTVLICWAVVTGGGRRPFLQTLGWGWHPQFKWVHAVGLAFLMMGFAILLEKILPHKETDLEKLLKLGAAVRVLVAALAVLTAPFVEEVVYRGVLYAGIEQAWGRSAGITIVTLLFALVHVPQYWASYAVITGILSLSLVLTMVRAATGKLLPCVATHLIFNGVQAVALLVVPDKAAETQQIKTALVVISHLMTSQLF